MKRLVTIVVVLTVSMGARAGREASWDDQLNEMNYLIINISIINAINAMNLSHEQAAGLRELARQVERAGGVVPKPRGAFHEGLRETRATYHELREILLREGEITKDFEERVVQAREAESEVISKSLAAGASSDAGCARCHQRPAAGKATSNRTAAARGDYAEIEVFREHLVGLFSDRGVAQLRRLVGDVDVLLTDSQKDIIQNFACCLLPPGDLADPVRAGQAEAPDRVMKALRFCRSCPAERWPILKERLVGKIVQGRQARSPGVTAAELETCRRNSEKLLQTVRDMSDTEFEMKKEHLAAQFQPDQAALNSTQREFMAAFYLLSPGAADVYSEVMRRSRRGGRRAQKR